MADKPTTPDAPQEGPRRKTSAPPTIDLTAQELESKPADRPADPPQPPPYGTGEQGKPAQDSGASDFRGKSRSKSTLIGVTLAAGFVGAVIAAGALAALWFIGYVPARDSVAAVTQDRIAALQTQLNELQRRPAAADGKAIETLSGRLGKIEQALANLPARDPAVGERLAAADNAVKSLGIALTALNKRNDDIAANADKAQQSADAAVKAVTELRANVQAMPKNSPAGISPAELESVQQRLAAVEQAAKQASGVAPKNTTVDNAARLALSAAALRDAVTSGAPFAAELTQVQSLGADGKSLAALGPFAAAGVPSDTALAYELSALMPAMLKASGTQAPSGDLLDRLQASAGRLVRVSPIDAPAGNDVSAVLARIEIDAAKANIAAALADLGKLPDKVRNVAVAWIERAKGRAAALDAARQIATDAARGLGHP